MMDAAFEIWTKLILTWNGADEPTRIAAVMVFIAATAVWLLVVYHAVNRLFDRFEG
jgi:hypothetical protein